MSLAFLREKQDGEDILLNAARIKEECITRVAEVLSPSPNAESPSSSKKRGNTLFIHQKMGLVSGNMRPNTAQQPL